MDTATDFLFGESVGALAAVERANAKTAPLTDPRETGSEALDSGAVAASSEFTDALRAANDGTVLRIRLQNLYWLGDSLGFRRSIRTVKRFAEGFVEKALARVETEGKAVEGKEKYGLLETLAAQTKDREDLVSQTLGEHCHLRAASSSLTPQQQ